MPAKDYYQILGVRRDASDKEVRQAYRRLARQHHPDVNPGNKGAEAKFKEINEAYETLADPEKRRRYDQMGEGQNFAEAGPGSGSRRQTRSHPGFESPGLDLDDLFQGLFHGASGFRMSRKGRDVDYPVGVTLEEAFHGTTRLLELQGREPCPTCKGRGGASHLACPTCSGSGAVLRPRRLEVKIPPGVRDGSRVRIAGEGQPGQGGAPGDLYLVIKEQPHTSFQRQGDDLHVEVPVPVWDLALGGEAEVPTVKGKIALKVPPETQNGQVFRLSSQGMPHLGDSSRGDLYARVKAVIPTKLDEKERALFGELKAMRVKAGRR